MPAADRYQTPYRSPQGQLWKLGETLWKLATKLPDYAPRKRRPPPSGAMQDPSSHQMRPRHAKLIRA
ncbi:MAG TPA: hypothetical protein VKT82_08370 [Ktedonobacterales bacterium]|nr:hypothetical protein [Ktedonobacterales bacterium]